MIAPYDWQLPAVDKITGVLGSGKSAAQASDTGTGKTIIALEAIKRLQKMRTLVVAPKSVIRNWHWTAKEMDCSHLILDVINVEKLQRGMTKWYNNGRWFVPKDGAIIWDEAHRGACGPNTITTRIMGLTKAYNIPAIVGSATLATTPLSMRALGYLLDLHQFNRGSFYSWCRRNGCYSSPFHEGLEFPKGPSGAEHMQNIHKSIADRMVRLRVSEIPGFPENEVQANLYDLGGKYAAKVNEAYWGLSKKLLEPGANVLVDQLRAREMTENLKVPIMAGLAEDILDEGKSVVAFVNFRSSLIKLRKEIETLRPEVIVSWIHGDQTPDERGTEIERFQENKAHVMLCMAQAGSIGVNLQDIKHERMRVSLISPSYSAVDMTQCLGRTCRSGGTKALQIIVLIANSVEEKIHAAIKRKIKNISALNDGANGGLEDSDLALV